MSRLGPGSVLLPSRKVREQADSEGARDPYRWAFVRTLRALGGLPVVEVAGGRAVTGHGLQGDHGTPQGSG